jgi:hypothetical protein
MSADQFRTKPRFEDRELRKVEGQETKFKRFPLPGGDRVELRRSDYEEAQRLVRADMRESVEDAARSGVIEWCNGNRPTHHPLFGSIGGAPVCL